jgi:hypothetical protein
MTRFARVLTAPRTALGFSRRALLLSDLQWVCRAYRIAR